MRRPSSARGRSCAQPYWRKTCPECPWRSVGAVAGEEGTVVWAEGFGWRDVATRAPVTPDTRFNIGTAASAVTAAVAPLGLTNTGADAAKEWSPEAIGEEEEDFPLLTLLRHVIWQPLGLCPRRPAAGRSRDVLVPRSDDTPGRGRRPMYMRDLACCANGMAFYSTPSDLVRFALATNPGSVNGELAGGTVMSLMTGATAASSSLSRQTSRTRTRPRWRCESGTRSRNRRDDRAGQRLGSIVAEKPSSTVTFQSSFADSTLM